MEDLLARLKWLYFHELTWPILATVAVFYWVVSSLITGEVISRGGTAKRVEHPKWYWTCLTFLILVFIFTALATVSIIIGYLAKR